MKQQQGSSTTSRELAERPPFADGHDLDDWLKAEAQLARAEPMTIPPRH